MSRRLFSTLETSMVDVSTKIPTVRVAVAQCEVKLDQTSYNLLKTNKLQKGNALIQAEIAGIMASKKTSHLIPLCHQINLDYSKITYEWCDTSTTLRILCSVQVTDKTGCEMEAIVGS